jgi:hydrogenase small subunit
MGAIPGLPKVHLHNRVLAYSLGGEEYLRDWFAAAEDRLGAPFILVIEGSIPNEEIKEEGYWAARGNDPRTGQPITLCEWIDRLAPRAFAVVAAGTCATYGGIHAMAGNPTGAMGLADYLGWDWRSKTGPPVINVPGCPVQPDNMTETLLYLLYQEQGDFAHEYGSPKCIVKLGCWGPVVNCNVTKRGWMNGLGGCPNVGGICIACTMPGFPDKFVPFMDEPPGGHVSSALVGVYGRVIRSLRALTNDTVNKEPKWRHRGRRLSTGYHPTTYGNH